MSRGNAVSRGSTVSRGSAVTRGSTFSRGAAVSRGYAQPRAYSSVARGSVRVAPRYIGSRGFGGGVRFSRPYYSFRPRFSLGFGLWAGYPVPYYGGYAYDDPYAYGAYAPSYPPAPYADPYATGGYAPSPYDNPAANPQYDPQYGQQQDPQYGQQQYGYPPAQDPSASYPPSGDPNGGYYPQQAPAGGSIGVQPGGQQPVSGGVSFQITPSSAAVFVDNNFVGTVGLFDPTSQPLGLTTGRHHIEIRASGYQTMTFDADIVAGQVIPYQGTLQVAATR
jgi:hypothetical protein